MIFNLKNFLGSLQSSEGGFTSGDNVKATAEYLLVHRFCPEMGIGDVERARTFLIDWMPPFALFDVGKGITSMEKMWQISTGIPEETAYLSGEFLRLALHDAMPASTVSSLLLVLFLQNIDDERMEGLLHKVEEYQRRIFEVHTLDSLYETTHNVMTFNVAKERFDLEEILSESCEWLSGRVLSFLECVDAAAEVLGIISWAGYRDVDTAGEILSILRENQNADGGFPVYAGGTSAFHSSLVALWALIESNRSFIHFKK